MLREHIADGFFIQCLAVIAIDPDQILADDIHQGVDQGLAIGRPSVDDYEFSLPPTSHSSVRDLPATRGILAFGALVPRYGKFESISLHRGVNL